MGGNGTIGGGKSCKARFVVGEVVGKRHIEKDHWSCDDDDMSYPFDITFKFTPGTTIKPNGEVVVTVNGKNDKVDISW